MRSQACALMGVDMRGCMKAFVWISSPFRGTVDTVWREQSHACVQEIQSRQECSQCGPIARLHVRAKKFKHVPTGQQSDISYSSIQNPTSSQALCESWRVELEEKQRQFDSVKAQLTGPRCGLSMEACIRACTQRGTAKQAA